MATNKMAEEQPVAVPETVEAPAETWEQPAAAVDEPIVQKFATEVKLFGKWSFFDLHISDETLRDYISVNSTKSKTFLPHTGSRWQQKKFRKGQCPLIERLVCSLLMHGRNSGKKMQAVRLVKQTLEIIHLLTGENPIQIFINAIQNAGIREDSTRIGSGGTVRRSAVDVSPLRRVNVGIYLICCGSRDQAFRNIKSMPECLADEIINCAKGVAGSYAIRKKDEIERIAKGNR